MKKIFICIIFFTCIKNTYSFDPCLKSDFFPILQNVILEYKLFKKRENKNIENIKVYIKNKKIIDDKEYYCYYSTYSGGEYLVRKDKKGIYIKKMKYEVPFLSFINVDIIFTPEVMFIKFPIEIGKSWTYKGIAKISLLKFINLDYNITGKLKYEKIENIKFKNKYVKSIKVNVVAEKDKKKYKGHLWFGEKVGYVRGITKDIEFYLNDIIDK